METEQVLKTSRKRVRTNTTRERLLEKLKNLSETGFSKTSYHNLTPGFNQSLQNFDSAKLEIIPSIHCSIPRSFNISSLKIDTTNHDICERRVVSYNSFIYKIRQNARHFETISKKRLTKTCIKNNMQPTCVIRAANLLKAYPYPYFSGTYDWYFTGGNLVHTKHFVFSPTGENMDILNLSVIKTKKLKSILNIAHNTDVPKKPTSEILEAQVSNFNNDEIIVRYENNIIKYVHDSFDLTSKYKIRDYKVPFITFSEDPCKENFIAIGNLDRQVFLWDINHSTTKPYMKLLSQNENILNCNDNWNIIRHYNSNTIIYVDFKKLNLIDNRFDTWRNKNNYSFLQKQIGECENISCLAVSSKYKNIMYFGTTHKLFGIDIRCLTKNLNNSIILKWTHQMKYPPLIIKTHNCENLEIIAISSPLSGEIRLFVVSSYQKIYTSPHLPINPPDLLSSYYMAKLQGECLSPIANIEWRLKRCTTGIDLIERDDKLQLLIINSIGDVFSSKIKIGEEIEYTDKYNLSVIKKYFDAVLNTNKLYPNDLYVTDTRNIKNIGKILSCSNLESRHCTKSKTEKVEKIRKKFKWEKNSDEYADFNDILAPNLLSIWNLGNAQIDFDKDEMSKENSELRIENWIDDAQNHTRNNNFISDPSKTEFESLLNDSQSECSEALHITDNKKNC